MDGDTLFFGSAIGQVTTDGLVRLPWFVRRAMAEGSRAVCLFLGAHESDPCVAAYHPGRLAAIHEDLERQRRRDETNGAEAGRHHARARRAFGTIDEAGIGESGEIVLPPATRRRGRIGALALFVGTGAGFEIWDPALAREAGGAALREIAEYRLDEDGSRTEGERN